MAQYTSDANLVTELPASLPAGLDSAAERLPYVEQASALADALVGPDFPVNAGQRFPDIGADPPTPPVVELATRKLAASMVYGALHVVNGGGGADMRETLSAEALEWFRRIREREIALTGADGGELGMDDTVTSSTCFAEPTFRVGRYDADGSLLDDTEGSLDSL